MVDTCDAASRRSDALPLSEPAGFITALESVRGIAALAVVLVHACFVLAGPDWALLRKTIWAVDSADEFARRVILALFNGNAAVSLFFVLSGFVLALSLRRDERAPLPLSGVFAARRYLRIYPPLLVNLMVTFVVMMVLSALFPLAFHSWTLGELGANLTLVAFPVNGPTWTMLVEFLAIPLLLACHFIALRFGRRGLAIMALFSLAGVLIGDRVVGRLLPTDGPFWSVVFAYLVDYQLMFVLGMFVGTWRARLRISTASAASGLAAAAAALLGARALFGFSARLSIIIEALAAGTIIAILAKGPRLSAHALLERGPLRFLGRISYSLYLYHATAIALVVPLLTVAMGRAWLEANPYSHAAIASAAVLAVAIPFSWTSYVLVERPTIRLGRGI